MSAALVLAGGGAKGSFQAGVVQRVAELGVYPDGFDIISGTSVGAINGAFLAQWPAAGFRTAADMLVRLWLGIRGDADVFKLLWPPFLRGAWSTSLATVEPIEAKLRAAIDGTRVRASGVRLRICATDILNKTLRIFDESEPDIVKAVLASSAFPMAFPLVPLDSGLYTDGGTRDTAPLGEIMDLGADRILVALCSDPDAEDRKQPTDFRNVMHVGARILDIVMTEVLANDIRAAQDVNIRVAEGRADADHRHLDITVVRPRGELGSTLSFDPTVIRAQIEAGRRAAEETFR
jgi:NTE family protein